MSENAPSTPPVPPTPGEAAKVQPKKETVRIALPPKPSAAPTVRLPSPPPGGAAPTAATAAPVSAAKPAAAAAPAPRAPSAAPAAPAPMARPMPMAPVSSGVSGLDKGLAVAIAVLGLAFLIHVVLIAMGIQVE